MLRSSSAYPKCAVMVFIQYLHAVATEGCCIVLVLLIAGKSSRLYIHPVQAIFSTNPECTIMIFKNCGNGIITQAVQIFCFIPEMREDTCYRVHAIEA